MSNNKKIAAIDFDGTLVKHEFPKVGAELPDAFRTLRDLQAKGWHLILFTMRSKESLEEAVEFCRERGVEFWGINENPEQKDWTTSPKVYAQVYIDDAALGAPVVMPPPTSGDRPWVDWGIVRHAFGLGE